MVAGVFSGFEGKTLFMGVKTSPLHFSFRFLFRPFDFLSFLVELSPSWIRGTGFPMAMLRGGVLGVYRCGGVMVLVDLAS